MKCCYEIYRNTLYGYITKIFVSPQIFSVKLCKNDKTLKISRMNIVIKIHFIPYIECV